MTGNWEQDAVFQVRFVVAPFKQRGLIADKDVWNVTLRGRRGRAGCPGRRGLCGVLLLMTCTLLPRSFPHD